MGQEQYSFIAGVDEAGRGPLAGPVIAAAVILDHSKPALAVYDSKKLSEKRRDALYLEIREHALAFGVGRAEVEEIDRINILQATMLAMQRAVAQMAETLVPTSVIVDGNKSPALPYPTRAIIKGDMLEPAISAASIIAKVERDREMCELDKQYPTYGFAKHKGYGTKQHREALIQFGASPVHRRSFAPVRAALQNTRTSHPEEYLEE